MVNMWWHRPVGVVAPGLRTPYCDPPTLSDPTLPGFTVNSGRTGPIRSCTRQVGALFTSQDRAPTNLPLRSGTVVGRRGARSEVLPDPPAWAKPGVIVGPRGGQVRRPLHAVVQLDDAEIWPGTMCIGDGIGTRWPASTWPHLSRSSASSRWAGRSTRCVFVDASGRQPSMVWRSEQNARSYTVDTQIWSQPVSAPRGQWAYLSPAGGSGFSSIDCICRFGQSIPRQRNGPRAAPPRATTSTSFTRQPTRWSGRRGRRNPKQDFSRGDQSPHWL